MDNVPHSFAVQSLRKCGKVAKIVSMSYTLLFIIQSEWFTKSDGFFFLVYNIFPIIAYKAHSLFK